MWRSSIYRSYCPTNQALFGYTKPVYFFILRSNVFNWYIFPSSHHLTRQKIMTFYLLHNFNYYYKLNELLVSSCRISFTHSHWIILHPTVNYCPNIVLLFFWTLLIHFKIKKFLADIFFPKVPIWWGKKNYHLFLTAQSLVLQWIESEICETRFSGLRPRALNLKRRDQDRH